MIGSVLMTAPIEPDVTIAPHHDSSMHGSPVSLRSQILIYLWFVVAALWLPSLCFSDGLFHGSDDGCSDCRSSVSACDRNFTNGSIDHGYAVLLPGILGSRFWDRNLASGLRKTQFRGAIEIYDWTRGPLLLGLNNFGGDREQALVIASKIVRYQDRYPGRPVYLFGHSAGCKMVVKSLAALPRGYQVDRVFLLASGIDSNYDLRPTLARTRFGIVAFHSLIDAPLALPLTGLDGIVHGNLNLASGVFGFKAPSGMNLAEREYYDQMLIQKSFGPDMIAQGNLGGHFGTTRPAFVARQIGPLLTGPKSRVQTSNSKSVPSSLAPAREVHRLSNPDNDSSIYMTFSG